MAAIAVADSASHCLRLRNVPLPAAIAPYITHSCYALAIRVCVGCGRMFRRSDKNASADVCKVGVFGGGSGRWPGCPHCGSRTDESTRTHTYDVETGRWGLLFCVCVV